MSSSYVFLCRLKENLLFHSLSCPFPLPLCFSFGRDLRLPLQQQLISRSPTRCGTWIVGPNSIASCHEEGALRLLYLDPLHYASSKDAQLTSMFYGKQGKRWSVVGFHWALVACACACFAPRARPALHYAQLTSMFFLAVTGLLMPAFVLLSHALFLCRATLTQAVSGAQPAAIVTQLCSLPLPLPALLPAPRP